MADLNPVAEDISAETQPAEKRTSKPRVSLPRNSLLTGSTAAPAGQRARRQSSRNSVPRAALDRRLIRYENTFRMEPDDDHRVDIARLRRVATSVIETAISGYKYDATQGKQFATALADRIRSQVRQLPFQRYKVVVQVVIGQKKGQDLRVASRCVWDMKWDRHLTITKETNDAYVTVIIFHVYTD